MPIRSVPAAAALAASLPFLSPADNDLIRAIIRTNLGPADLPDQIVQFAFNPAMREVLAIDPSANYWAYGSPQWQNAHDAAVLFAAAVLLPMVPLVSRETFQGYSYGLEQGLPLADRIAMLRAQALEILAANLGEDWIALIQPKTMRLAPGGRGDVSDWIPGFPMIAWPASSQLAYR